MEDGKLIEIEKGQGMRNKIIFTFGGVGVLLALVSAYVYARPAKPQSPVFQPASNPYAQGIFANGIIESYQAHGENINIYPDVSGTVREILVAEGESVKQGTPLLEIDNTVQRSDHRPAEGPGGRRGLVASGTQGPAA